MRNSTIGQRVRELRYRRGMTQQILADSAGVSIKAISRLEQGKTNPRFDTLKLIAGALGVHVRQLTGRAVAYDPRD